MPGSRTFLFFLGSSLLLGLLGIPAQEKTPPESKSARKAGPPEDPQLEAIAKAMKALASKPIPVHFKIRMTARLPMEDQPLVAEGELWAVGDKKLHYLMVLKPGRLAPTKQEVVLNPQGAWMRFAMGKQVVFFPPDLVARLKKIQKEGRVPMAAPSARNQIDLISALRAQGFHLAWRGQKKLGRVVVDEIQGTRAAPGRSGASMEDPEGKIDRVVLLVGEKDRIPRRIEWFAGKERVRLQEYTDVTVGKKIPEDQFQLKLEPGETVVNALDHPILGPTLKEILDQGEKGKKG